MSLDTLRKGKFPGGVLVAHALESAGITHAFGIPGTHNIELYDALAQGAVRPILVTDEKGAGFICDGMARSGGPLGCANVVPGAGVTEMLSATAEAWMDNVPLLVLACGIRRDSEKRFQLHDIDQLAMLRPVCKQVRLVEEGRDLPYAILEAAAIARATCPGPSAVEIPANLYLARHAFDPQEYARWKRRWVPPHAPAPDPAVVRTVAELLLRARQPLVHVGLGAAGAAPLVRQLVEHIGAIASSTFSGKGVIAEDHPQWLWPGIGRICPQPLRAIVAECDAALVLGARLGEVPTGSYGLELPSRTAQVDIDPAVAGANFPVEVAVHADCEEFLEALLEVVNEVPERDNNALCSRLADAHVAVRREQEKGRSRNRVSPRSLLEGIQRQWPEDTVYTTDSGQGTFYAMEHLRLRHPRCFLAPTDFSCMGYSVPAAIGAAFADRKRCVVALPGDGAFLMTGLELLTAVEYALPVAVFLLNDGELGQISAFQRALTGTATATVLPRLDPAALARALGVAFYRVCGEAELDEVLGATRDSLKEGPVLVDVSIDYRHRTSFTAGVVQTFMGRLPVTEKMRLAGRLLGRRLL